MAYQCDICGKGPKVANHVSHSNIKTKRRQYPNLHRVRVLIEGAVQRRRICTRCLRSDKVTKAA